MELTETESLLLDIVTKATVVEGAQGYKPEYTKDKTEWKMLMRLKDAGLVEERRAGPRGGKRFFSTDPGGWLSDVTPSTVEPDKPEGNSFGSTTSPKATPIAGLSLTLTADGGVKLS